MSNNEEKALAVLRLHVIIHELLPFKGHLFFDKRKQNNHVSSHTLVSEVLEEEETSS